MHRKLVQLQMTQGSKVGVSPSWIPAGLVVVMAMKLSPRPGRGGGLEAAHSIDYWLRVRLGCHGRVDGLEAGGSTVGKAALNKVPPFALSQPCVRLLRYWFRSLNRWP